MITLVVPSPHSSSCVLLSSIMFFAAGCATSISRRIALPSLVSLQYDSKHHRTRKKTAYAQDTTHGIQDHLQHRLGAKTCPNNIRNCLRASFHA